MPEPIPPSGGCTGARFGRRRLLAAGGVAAGVAAGVAGGVLGLSSALAGRGANTGRARISGEGGPTLSQWYHQYGEANVEPAVRRYAAGYSRARVEVQWRPGDYDQETATALLTDVGPDVFETTGPSIDQIQAGQVADLTDAIGPEAADFNPVLLGQKSYRGRVFGIPQAVDMQMLYYRKSMLAAAGLAPPSTVDELVHAAAALTTGDVKGLFLGNDGGAGALGAIPLYSAGLSQIRADGSVGFDDRAASITLGKLRRLYADKSVLLGAPLDWPNPAALIQGLTAMQWTGLWALPQISKAFGTDFGVLPFPPDGPRGRPVVPVGAYACAVNAHGRLPVLAADYARWLWVRHTDYQREFAQSFGLHLPARVSLAHDAPRLRTGPAAEAVDLATRYGFADPLLWTARSRTAVQDALTRIIQDGADPAGQLATAVATVRAELARVQRRR
jgi:multiple sugar transport system substrate-binding protein